MSKHTESGLKNLKTQFLVVVLVITPIIFVAGHVQSVFAASSNDIPQVCVIATLNSNPSVLSSFGPCPKLLGDPEGDRGPRETPSSDPTATFPATTTSPVPTTTAAAPTPTTTVSTEGSDTNTAAPSSTPTPVETTETPHIHTEAPSPTTTPTNEETHTATPSQTSTQTPSPTPTTTTTAPASTVYDIPPENKDPNTKEFRFCHHGQPHSNSYTGMMSGHHDKHAEDIIPPIPFKFYKGWNWTEENAKTFYNNCVPVK